jgi:hypothetical protein
MNWDFVLVVFPSVYGRAFAFGIFYVYQLLRAAIRRLILPRATTGSNRHISASDPRHPVPVITSAREKQ